MYYTKKGTTPLEFRGFFDAVSVCRARQKAGLDLTSYPLPAWAEKAYLLGSGILQQVENELDDEDADSTNDMRIKAPGDSGAFALIHQHLEETGAKLKEEDG